MQYIATVRYENKSVTIKVTNKALEGISTLPEFLKKVREAKGHTIQQVHMMTDFETQDCQDYEDSKQRIPKLFLSWFTAMYKLPKKLVLLGCIPEKDFKDNIKSVLASRLQQLRNREELTQALAAADLDIARSTYAGYECGKNEPDLFMLVKLADYYQTSIDYLVGRTK